MSTEAVHSKLEQLFDMQTRLQIDKMGGHPAELDLFYPDNTNKVQFIKDMTLALTDELHEALGEVGWKPWAKSQHINREAYVGELVDALHFFINLCLVVDLTPTELFDRYVKKNQVNHKRQEEGYDGVSTKCPRCRRALDDEGVGCYQTSAFMDGKSWCEVDQCWL